MLNQLFLFELFSSLLPVRDTGIGVVEYLLFSAMEGKRPESMKQTSRLTPDRDDPTDNPFDRMDRNSVAVIPLRGMMTKNSYWWDGCDVLADLIRMADRSASIAGVILLIDTPGGTTSAVIQMEDALRSRTKPCVAVIDGECCSGGIYVASLCDEIYAVNRMCEVGSIGVFARIVDTREADKQWGYKVEQIYPPESKYKNLEIREALEGKPERLIREVLTPYAVHFQNVIKENRSRIDTSVEGILEGRTFYAFDAISNGLIDGLMNMEKATERVRRMAEEKQSFYSQFN
jgi:protease-4